jgi:hypothetical protein
MAAVAVGRFQEQGGRRIDGRLGVLEDGDIVAAHVAREAPGAADAVGPLGRDLQAAGAQQVAGAAVAEEDPGRDLPLLVERHGAEQLQGPPGVVPRVERLRVGVPAVPFFARVADLLLLDLPGVEEHQGDQSAAGLRAVDRPGEPLGNEARQEAGVIQVGMGEQHRVQPVGRERERIPVALLELFVSLEEAAVDEDGGVPPGEQGGAAGDATAGSEECDGRHFGIVLLSRLTGYPRRHDSCYSRGAELSYLAGPPGSAPSSSNNPRCSGLKGGNNGRFR